MSLLGVPRPEWAGTVNHILIPLDTGLYLVAIGSQMGFASVRPWWRPCLVMTGIKFLYMPLVALGLTALLGIDGLPRVIVLLEASTPVAV